jgi:hypothetical protein
LLAMGFLFKAVSINLFLGKITFLMEQTGIFFSSLV